MPRFIADIEIHSKYARAVSSKMVLENLALWADKKGIQVLGTGDFTHPLWFKDIKGKLEPAEPGLFKLRDENHKVRFILSGEISCIYKKGDKLRRVHHLIYAPSIEAAEKINTKLGWVGNLASDGRPIIGIDSKELLKILLDASPDCVLIPAHCLLPENIIHTKENLIKKIKNIKEGDLVFTHKNRWQKVEKVLKRHYQGRVYSIKPYYFREGLTVTPEHPFYAIKTKKNCCDNKGICKPQHLNYSRCINKYYKNYKPEWIRAEELEVGDVLIYPRFTRGFYNHKSLDVSSLVGGKNLEGHLNKLGFGGHRSNFINSVIPIDKNFCRLIGYYLAEGYTNGRDAVAFTFHKSEERYKEDVISLMKKVFGFDGRLKIRKLSSKATEIIFFSKILCELFSRTFYTDPQSCVARNKRLPNWALGLPLELQVEIFKGWWRGDKGYTVSRLLMNQMKIILLRLGIIPSIYRDSQRAYEKRGKHYHKGRKITSKSDLYAITRLSFFEDKFNLLHEPELSHFKSSSWVRHGWLDDEYIYLPIRDIEIGNYKGEVYNLEVGDDNSYVSEFATIHNCWTPWFGVFGSKSGFDSLEECFEELTSEVFAIETGLSCYDEETEVLTDDGWKRFKKLNKEDKICTINPKTEIIGFQGPLKLYKYKYKGKMYKLRTSRADLLVTPNHKLFFSSCDFRKRPLFKLKEAKSLFGKSKRFKKDGIWKGIESNYFILPAVKIRHGSKYYSGERLKKDKKFPMNLWLKFFGFWIAEGWVSGGKNGDYGVYLSNKNQALLQEMKKLLGGFGYDTYVSNNVLRVRDFQLFSYLKKFGHAGEKYIPQEVKTLSKELLRVFFDYYIKGDGHRYGRSGKGLSATTISIRLRDDLQEIALKMGFSAYYKLHNRKGTPIKSLPKAREKGYKQSKDSWVIYFIRKNIHTVLPSTVKKYGHTEKWVNYDGYVYCAQVPNHVMYVRRNGIPVWCGNSDPPMNWRIPFLDNKAIISSSDSHSLHRLGREATIFDTEISYKAIMDAMRSRGPELVGTVEFFPEEGKYHYDGHSACGVSFSPEETKKHNGICPKCGKSLTIGVMARVDELAPPDRLVGFKPTWAKPYYSFVPFDEVVAEALGVGTGTKSVWTAYDEAIKKFGSEFSILIDASEDELRGGLPAAVAEAVIRMRQGKVKIEPGYDGVYGKVKILENEEREELTSQKSLF